jgi:hypothetical protein
MDQDDSKGITFLRREFHAALAMHALMLNQDAMQPLDELAPVTDELIAKRAYEMADAMIAKGGPIE